MSPKPEPRDWAWSGPLYPEAPTGDFRALPWVMLELPLSASQPRPHQGSEHAGCRAAVSTPSGAGRDSFSTSPGLRAHVLCLPDLLPAVSGVEVALPFQVHVLQPSVSPFPPSNAQGARWPTWANAGSGPVIPTVSFQPISCFVTWDEYQPQFSHL